MKAERQSNIELLRIIAMFFVMVVHADVYSLGLPSSSEWIRTPMASFIRVFIESLAIVCVNVFVLISGWFGIKPSIKGFSRFIFQCFYFSVGIYVISVFIGHSSLSYGGILECIFLTPRLWFIKAYIALFILSPILNNYCEHVSKKQLEISILLFYAFQTIYGWTGAAQFVESGYSTFSFIGLYMLARYLSTYYTGCYGMQGG
jgi:surface polysaccharide O-acyltransferase-like enzyme